MRKIVAFLGVIFLLNISSLFSEVEKYDIHEHYIPEIYKDLLLRYGQKGFESDGLPLPMYDINKQISFMDKLGIKTAFISLASPHPFFNNKKEIIDVVRKINEDGYSIVKSYPKRFKLFATLPLPYVSESVEEIKYLYDKLNVSGIKLPTSSGGYYLGDEKFDEIFKELNNRKAIVFIHPTTFDFKINDTFLVLPPAIYNYLFETTITVLNLIFSGTIDKYPDIKFIIPHGGALLTSLSDRLIGFMPLINKKMNYTISDIKKILALFYYDLAGFSAPNQIFGLLNITDISHILYGSDYPYAYDDFIISQKNEIDKFKFLSKNRKHEIYNENFKKLFFDLGEKE